MPPTYSAATTLVERELGYHHHYCYHQEPRPLDGVDVHIYDRAGHIRGGNERGDGGGYKVAGGCYYKSSGSWFPSFSLSRLPPSALTHRVRMATVFRVMFVALISVLHAVSVLLCTVSLALGSGGPVETGAIVVDWLALITMAMFLLHRVKYRAREFIRPRSLIAFGVLTVVSAINLALFVVRFCTGDRGLVRDFRRVGDAEATALAVIVIAGVSTFLGVFGVIISYAGCYIEPPRTRSKKAEWSISQPMFDYRPDAGLPAAPPTPASNAAAATPTHSEELGHVKGRYVPGLFGQWAGPVARMRERMSVVLARGAGAQPGWGAPQGFNFQDGWEKRVNVGEGAAGGTPGLWDAYYGYGQRGASGLGIVGGGEEILQVPRVPERVYSRGNEAGEEYERMKRSWEGRRAYV